MTYPCLPAFLSSSGRIQSRDSRKTWMTGAQMARGKRLVLTGVGVLALLALGTVAGSNAAIAATATGVMGISATVQATCVVSATNMVFGIYTGVLSNNTATITATCTSSTPYTVQISAGGGTGPTATAAARHMNSGLAILNYSLFSDTLRTVNWGDTVVNSPASANGTGSGVPLTVYGQIPAAQYPVPGAFTDTVTVTISF